MPVSLPNEYAQREIVQLVPACGVLIYFGRRTVRNTAKDGWFAMQLYAFSIEPLDAGKVGTMVRVGPALEPQPPEQEDTSKQEDDHAAARDRYLVFETEVNQI